jgi:aromatic ring-cleaving dioxygenase
MGALRIEPRQVRLGGASARHELRLAGAEIGTRQDDHAHVRQLVEDQQDVWTLGQNRQLVAEILRGAFLEQVHGGDDFLERHTAFQHRATDGAHVALHGDDVVLEERARDPVEIVAEIAFEFGLGEGAVGPEVQRVQIVPMVEDAFAILLENLQNRRQAVDFLVTDEMEITLHLHPCCGDRHGAASTRAPM